MLASWEGKTIHRADQVVLRSLDPKFIDGATRAIERRNTLSVSVTEGELYFELNGTSLVTTVRSHDVT